MPDAFNEYWQTWASHHPGWELRDWSEANLPPLANQDLYVRASELAPGFEGQLRSDVARLEILREHGGVYLDADFAAFRSIEPLLEGVEIFAAWELDDRVVNNAILGATKGHPFIDHLIKALPGSVRSKAPGRPSKMSGPHFVTAELAKWQEPVTIFPRSMFYAIGCGELNKLSEPPRAGEYARHYWNNQQRLRGRRRR